MFKHNFNPVVIMVGNPMLLDENREGFDKVDGKVVSFYSVGEKRGGN